jgi:ABC-type uncharacterized transport system involved in gliding motility auxiliary subunit
VKITRHSRLLLRLQGYAFTLLFTVIIGLLAWLSTEYVYQADWTASSRNTVSGDTRRLLDSMEQPISITAFARENTLQRTQIRDVIGSYQRFKDDINLEFVNPDTAPERVRELGITMDGEILVSYRGRSENVRKLSERQLTNALLRISRQDARWIVFVSGHGERSPFGKANHDLGLFGKELERKGLNIQTTNLAETGIPGNTHTLVLASPRVRLLPGEIKILQNYVRDGGNLLWLAEPGEQQGLEPLAEQLGIAFLPGMVVDATAQMFGVENPAFVVVTEYPRHESTSDMDTVTVFPEAVALEINATGEWNTTPLLLTLERSWTELSELEGDIRFDPGTDERAGPLDIGVALTRTPGSTDEKDSSEQRVIVIGDGDFLANAYLGNAGNLDLGLNMTHWLSHDETMIDIHIRSAPDTSLVLGKISQAFIGLGFLLGLPALLLISGIVIWIRRRRR